MTALLITLGVSMILFVTSLIRGLMQETDTGRYCQYLIGTDEKTPVHASFGRAARRPARILGTFIF